MSLQYIIYFAVCSCSDDCEKDGNCCFQNQSEKLDDNAVQTTKQFRECLHPISKSENNVFTVYQSYNMISSERTNFTVTCGDVRVAPWGNMYPVYSNKTGEIYKNRVCAEAYDVTDGEEWDAFMSCKNNRFKYDAASFVSSLQRGFIPEFCSIRFIFGGDKSLLKSKVCYNVEDYEINCVRDFRLPTISSASREEIVNACKSGLISPYNKMFANVFCFICGQLSYVFQEQRCIKVDGNKELGTDASFVSIIDPKYINTNVRVELGKTRNSRIACRNSTKGNHQVHFNESGLYIL